MVLRIFYFMKTFNFTEKPTQKPTPGAKINRTG